MSHKLPTCKNPSCPKMGSRDEVIVLQERPEDVTFGCKCCGGVQVRTLDWKRAEQGRYEQRTNPEYARVRRRFFLGKHNHIGG